MAYQGIQDEFHISRIVAILGLSLFVIGLGIGPMLLGPLSEFYGRRPVYIVSYTAFTLLGLPVSFANNLAVFLIFRFLTGFCGSAFLSVAGGSVSDIFAASDIFVPMSIYTNGPFLGPVFGPLLSGFINQNTNWRWTFWTINIWSAVMLAILTSLVLKRTRLPCSPAEPNDCERKRAISNCMRSTSMSLPKSRSS